MDKVNGLYRRDGKLVYIKQPEFKDLSFVKELWSDYETMKELGGIFEFHESKWELFYKKMIAPTDGKNFYSLIYNYDNKPVGEVSFHGYDSATKIARFNIKVQNKFRNRGYGSEATRLMLEYYFNEFGGKVIMDTVVTETGKNTIGKFGFEAIRKHGNEITYRLTKDAFLSIHKTEKRRIGIFLYEGCDFMSVATVYEIFSLANKAKDEAFEVFTIGENVGNIKTSVGAELNINISLNDIEKLDILVLPATENIEIILNNEKIQKFINNKFDKLEVVLGIANGALLLVKSGLLEGLMVNIDGIYRDKFKEKLNKVNLSDKSIVDNGRVILANNINNTLDASLYIIKKLLGEDKSREVIEIIEGKNK
ncbi:Acetyltransferase (GNAT) domain-containing protein [Clostridium cavendishii DSM 21758]|uniref:Acetyltransferase (GNAT) domain-containing protein n=1 Tax=Clostridium cavendishii DSM 21758 TaxID=1121302 RepID=A0A1M6AG92_9CLOT|nr:GNAT family N-acetyltransferase [Clostridium cavendishii]SHI35520.1 Acetyltransferase (GNAT) domain-containing protein [Clostridium cavendishii DSM 21758]